MMVAEIPTDYAFFVQRLVAERRFLTETDVVTAALRLLQAREELRQEVRLGFHQLDAGLGVSSDAVYARAEERIQEIENEMHAAQSCRQ